MPAPYRDWVRARAERHVEEVTAAGYPVLGRLEVTVPDLAGRSSGLRRGDVLEVVVAALLERSRPGATRERM